MRTSPCFPEYLGIFHNVVIGASKLDMVCTCANNLLGISAPVVNDQLEVHEESSVFVQ